MWQTQVDIDHRFENSLKIGDTFKHQEVTYKISGIGHIRVICSNESCCAVDLVFLKNIF